MEPQQVLSRAFDALFESVSLLIRNNNNRVKLLNIHNYNGRIQNYYQCLIVN